MMLVESIIFTIRSKLLIHDDFLGNDVHNQCVSRGHIEAPRLGNYVNTTVNRKILIQGWVDYSCDLREVSTSTC